MRQIEKIYVNTTGMAFFWKQEEMLISDKVQLVFKETGFYFSVEELREFMALIEDSCLRNKSCESCAVKTNATNSCSKRRFHRLIWRFRWENLKASKIWSKALCLN